ncbi:MAG: TPM domain-containing protein, partial [Gemmatimonadetes bacterium]|nr:TPM domain-containing protein [Gemmatimonadota bacterium]
MLGSRRPAASCAPAPKRQIDAALRLRPEAHMTSRKLWALLLVLAGAALPAGWVHGQQPLPKPTGYVNDFAGILSPDDEAAITRVIDEVRAKSGGEMVVVTLPTLLGRTADRLALELGRGWRVGRSGQPGDPARNTGLIFLVVPKETSATGRGALRIETGLGTNTFITAAEAGAFADDFVIPAFRQVDYGQGIRTGVTALARQYAQRFGFELSGDIPPLPERRPPRGYNLNGILVPLIILAGLISVFGRGGPRGRGRRRNFPI